MASPGLQCSFRGVPFRWDERGGETTPRFAEHDFPQKPGRWHEDMAEGPRVFTFTAFLIAPDTRGVRDELVLFERACRNQEPGVLMHPVFGLLSCVCKGFTWKENRETLNRIDLDLKFEEDIGMVEPMTTRWIGADLADAVDAAEEAIADALDEFWELASIPAYALADAEDAIGDVVGALSDAVALLTEPVQAALAVACDAISTVDEISGLGQGLVDAFTCLTTDSYGNPLGLTADQADATYRALTPLAGFTLAQEAADTASKATVAQAMSALSVTVRRLALLQMANLTRQMTFVSSADAIDTRDSLSDMMTVEIVAAADQASTDSDAEAGLVSDRLDAARSEMVADLTATAATLVPVAAIVLGAAMPSGQIVYALYGDGDGSAAARANTLAIEADFIARNAVQDPGLTPGGVPLEYWLDAQQQVG
jgi:prophage DNA circulation protein